MESNSFIVKMGYIYYNFPINPIVVFAPAQFYVVDKKKDIKINAPW